MMLSAYSIYDRKALQYHPPFFASADGQAVRSVQDLVGDPNTMIGRHPSDFVLFRVGTYDDSTGGLMPVSPIEHVVDAIALVKRQAELFDGAEGSIVKLEKHA